MTIVEMPEQPVERSFPLGHEVDDMLLRLRGLVLVRDLLAERGASTEELDAHTREAERVRLELATLIAGPGVPGQVGAAA
jgi:hypothetical protein